MNAVIYARYSPGPKQTEQSIEGQVRDCREYAESHNINVLKVYADRHISGTDFERRREFNRMIADSEAGQFEAIIVWKIDRFGRDREEIALNKIKLKRRGIKLIYAKEVIPDGPEGIILESLMEGLAEYYVADLRQKVVRGLKESALKGLAVTGKAPFGYSIDENKKYIENENESWVVRWVFEQYAGGTTATEIIEELKKKGVRSHKGTPITKNGIYSMLRNEKYIGKCFYGSVPIPIPALVDEDLWNRVQCHIVRRPHSSAVYKAPEKYQLSLKAYCGECGAMLLGDSGYGKLGQKYSYYKCGSRKKQAKTTKCTLPAFRKELLEDFVARCTFQDVLNSEIIDYIAEKVVEISKIQPEACELDSLKANLKECERNHKNLLRAVEDGLYSPAARDRILELEDQMEEIKVQIAMKSIEKPKITKEHVIYWLELFKKGDLNDSGFLQRLFDVFVHSVYIYKDKVVIAYNYSSDNNYPEALDVSDIAEGSDTFVKVDDRGLYPNIFILPDPPVFLYICNSIVA